LITFNYGRFVPYFSESTVFLFEMISDLLKKITPFSFKLFLRKMYKYQSKKAEIYLMYQPALRVVIVKVSEFLFPPLIRLRVGGVCPQQFCSSLLQGWME